MVGGVLLLTLRRECGRIGIAEEDLIQHSGQALWVGEARRAKSLQGEGQDAQTSYSLGLSIRGEIGTASGLLPLSWSNDSTALL